MINKGIIVIGGGTSGLLTTLFMAKNYPNKTINWIYPEENETIGVGEATIQYVVTFMENLGISKEIIKYELNGNAKVGIKFSKFFDKDRYHPFGHSLIKCSHLVNIMKEECYLENPKEWPAYQFDVNELHKYCADIISKLHNVEVKRRYFSDVDIESNNLIIDCTGFDRKIISKFLPENVYKSPKIHNDTALIFRKDKALKKSFSTFTALDNGWVWEIPLLKDTSYGFVYDSSLLEEIVARGLFRDFLGVESDFRKIPMKPGRNVKHFAKNNNGGIITAVGLSSCFIEPLESTGLFFVCYTLDKLKELIDGDIDERGFEKNINHEFDTTVEFILAHFKLASHKKYEQYKKHKLIMYAESEAFGAVNWKYVTNQRISDFSYKKFLFDIKYR